MVRLLVIICLLKINILVCQTDSTKYAGIYLDEFRIEKSVCCNFDNLTIVIPYDSICNKFSLYNIWVKITDLGAIQKIDSGFYFTVKPMLLETVKSGYIVFPLFEKDEKKTCLSTRMMRPEETIIPWSSITKQTFCESLSKSKRIKLEFWLEGVEPLIDRKKEKVRYVTDAKYGIRITLLSKIYSYKLIQNSSVDCKTEQTGLKLKDL